MSPHPEFSTVDQIQLTNSAFEGRNSVYLLGTDDDDTPVSLIDTGVATPDVEAELRNALAKHGESFETIDQILLTHWHHDHAGLSGMIQSESDATVYVHEADSNLVAQTTDSVRSIHDQQRAFLDQWGMPEQKQQQLLDFIETHDTLSGEPAVVTPLSDGDTVSVGERDLKAVHLPGHAAGLLAYTFERDGRREAFVGDAVLPKYTPNVGGADVRVERPLQQYIDSLTRVESLDLDRAWPGHRGPIFAPTARARDIAKHHDERTARVRRVVEESAPVTAWEVSDELFGSLSAIHILHGPGEAYAHLDHLVHEGILRETASGYAPV